MHSAKNEVHVIVHYVCNNNTNNTLNLQELIRVIHQLIISRIVFCVMIVDIAILIMMVVDVIF